MRLFVALDLPDAVRGALPAPGPPWRAVPAEQLHVTLVFLGAVEDPDPVIAALSAAPAVPLRADGIVLLPNRRPRVMAVRFGDVTGELVAFQRRLAAALDREEERPWLPHVTIGRVREPLRRKPPPPEVADLEFVAPALTLYRSAGGRYEPLSRHTSDTKL